MKRNYFLSFSALLFTAMSWGQVLQPPTTLHGAHLTLPGSPSLSHTKSSNCSDTLRYPLAKEVLLNAPGTFQYFDVTQSDGYKFTMTYLNTEPTTVNGVELYGLVAPTSGANLEVTVDICSVDASNNPTAVLASVVIPVTNTNPAGAFIYGTLPTPVTVTGNYAVQVSTTSAGGVYRMVINNGAVSAYDENFARIGMFGFYFPIPTGFGSSVNFEPILHPIVSYPVNADYTTSATSVCQGTEVTFSNTSTPASNLTDRFESMNSFLKYWNLAPTDSTYEFDYDDGNVVYESIPAHTYATAGAYDATLNIKTGFSAYCLDTKTTTITVNAVDNANFTYSSNTICTGGANEVPTINTPGIFTATPAGLTFVNTATGEIDVAATANGTYAITNTTSGVCPDTVTQNITFTTSPDASFSYSQTSYCTTETDPVPSFGSGASAGVFSATAGLVINSATGEIDLSASTPGSYLVTNSISASGVCPATSATFTIAVEESPTAAVSGGGQLCGTGTIPVTITFTGAGPWDFTYTDGTTPTTITGQTTSPYTISASANGTYSVTSVTQGSCSTVGTGSATVTFFANPTVTFDPLTDVCLNDAAVTLSAAPSGGSFTGTNVVASYFLPIEVGTETLTYSYTDVNGCTGTATQDITVNALPEPVIDAIADLCVYNSAVTLTATPTGGTFSGTGVTGSTFTPATAGVGTWEVTYDYTDVNGCSEDTVATIVVDSCLNVSETDFDQVSVYPNPSDDVVYIKATSNISYAVYTDDGKLVIAPTIIQSGVATVAVDAFARGVYFIQLTDGTNISTRKIVLK